MNFKLDLRQPVVQLGILEVIFPIAGYFFWDWSLMIIVFYYLIDWASAQMMYTKRLIEIKDQFNERLSWVVPLSIIVSYSVIAVATIFLYYYFEYIYVTILKLDLNQAIIKFSIDELWYLIPLVLFSYHLVDKMLFYTPKAYKRYSVRPYLYKNIWSNLLGLGFILLGALIYNYIIPSDIVTIFLIVGVKLSFDVIVKKNILKID